MNSSCPRLIEVALPIREISAESVRQKKAQRGHISTLHLWWARRPISATRAVVFASLVPDPDHPACPLQFRKAVQGWLKDEVPAILKGYRRGRNVKHDPDPYRPYPDIPDTPRNRLLTFIAKWSPEWLAFERGQSEKQPGTAEMLDDRCLVKWETSDPDNEQGREILRIARELVRLANGDEVPTVLDPFAGGGAIPLEANRLGCQSIANDYNPVAYLILRATCEFPQKYGKPGKRLVEREEYGEVKREEVEVKNALAYDVEYWVKWIIEHARQRVGYLYPPGKDGRPVMGYLWARTAPCSNPVCRAEIPLLRSLLVSNKSGKRAALEMDVQNGAIQFEVVENQAIMRTDGTMLTRGDVRCPVCLQVTPVADLRRAGLEGKMSERMVAVIAIAENGKTYRAVEQSDLIAFQEALKMSEEVERPGELILPEITGSQDSETISNSTGIRVHLYGMKTWGSLFNPRQLVLMQTLVKSLHQALNELEKQDLDAEYREAIATYLGLWISRSAARYCSVTVWNKGEEKFEHPFGRQAIPMTWDYPEPNPFIEGSAGLLSAWDLIRRVVIRETFPIAADPIVLLGDATRLPLSSSRANFVITDPPYFDAISYADLSDYFYVWLKRGLGSALTEVFSTPLTPKTDEATALKHRHNNDSERAKNHFTNKLATSLAEAKRVSSNNCVFAIMFAHQSTEAWTALIQALFDAGLSVTATYPIDTELVTALKALESALASSITVTCRPRQLEGAAAFRDVRREVEQSVAESVHRFWEYGFRGADLIVACYGPAVGVFGRYTRVERADGTPVGVPELLDLARQAALKAIAGEFTGDSLSRLYFVWANLYGIGEQAWDDARLVVQVGGDSEDAMQVARGHDLFVVDGSICRLALLRDRANRRRLGDEPGAPLIDQLHHAMQLWKAEKRADLVIYLRENGLSDHAPFWKLAQALFEVLPHGEEDWKLISALLGERETLRVEVRRAAPPEQPRQGTLFDL